MANELTINLPTITFVKSPFSENLQPFSGNPIPGVLQVNVTGSQIIHSSVASSTSDATVNKGAIGTYGWVLFVNRGTLGNILIGSDGTLYPLILQPGEGFPCRWNAAAIHYKASAGTPVLEVWAVEA